MTEPKFNIGARVTDGSQKYTVVDSKVLVIPYPDGSEVSVRRYTVKADYGTQHNFPESKLSAAGGRRRKTRKHKRVSRKTRRYRK
jgi:hypothetical protein